MKGYTAAVINPQDTTPPLLSPTPDCAKAIEKHSQTQVVIQYTVKKNTKTFIYKRALGIYHGVQQSTVALLWLGTTHQGRDTQSAHNSAETTNLITYMKKKKRKKKKQCLSQITVLCM